jgi:hypothetical protein
MDYHPEIEARMLERHGVAFCASLLRRIDRASMNRFEAVIVLDRAMATIAESRAGTNPVMVHPTWGERPHAGPTPLEYTPGEDRETLRLAYSGNLGKAHDLGTFELLLRVLARRLTVELYVVGASREGNEQFQRIGAELGVKVTTHERVPFPKLRDLYNRWHIDAGLVLLSEGSAGLLSPSKFSGYIDFGVPIIYIGPSGTNTQEACTRFKAGFALAGVADDGQVAAVADSLLNPGRMKAASEGARAAALHYSLLNNDSLAALIAPLLARANDP